MPSDEQRDYEVGYGKPPRHTRFQQGRSGNPRGRPKGAKNLATLLSEALNETVTVAENGGRRKITKRQAIITQLVNRSAQADLKATQILLPVMQDVERRSETAPAERRFRRGRPEGHRAAQSASGATASDPPVFDGLTRSQYEALLRQDFATFAARCFHDLNPQAELAINWHLEVIAAKLTAVRQGRIRRLIINLPPRHLKSLLASIAFPAWCLGHDPSAQILCVSYAQDLADKLARDCRSIMTSPWYRRIFPTRLAPHRQAVQEFITTRQGYRLATSTGGVLTGRGADIILIDDPLKPEEALSDAQRQAANEWFDHTLYSRLNDKRSRRHRHHHAAAARGRPGRPRAGAGAMGGRALSGDRRGRRGARDRDDLGTAIASPAARARPCIPAASRSTSSTISAARSANTISPASISNRPPRLGGGLVKADWFKRYRRARTAGALRPHRAELGHRQQGDRAQRFLASAQPGA